MNCDCTKASLFGNPWDKCDKCEGTGTVGGKKPINSGNAHPIAKDIALTGYSGSVCPLSFDEKSACFTNSGNSNLLGSGYAADSIMPVVTKGHNELKPNIVFVSADDVPPLVGKMYLLHNDGFNQWYNSMCRIMDSNRIHSSSLKMHLFEDRRKSLRGCKGDIVLFQDPLPEDYALYNKVTENGKYTIYRLEDDYEYANP